MIMFSEMNNRKRWFLCTAVLALAAFSFGQGRPRQDLSHADVAAPACQSTFNYGSGQTLFNFCISANGNLVQFTSPEGFEHIREGDVGEGYGICDAHEEGPNMGYFDYAQQGVSSNWRDPVLTQPGGPNTFPLKITRATSDGVFVLTQSFARNTGERIVKITMTLKNTSGVPKTANLLRYANINANNADHGDYFNWFDYGTESAWGYNTAAYGLAVSIVPTNLEHFAIMWYVNYGPDPCNSTQNVPDPLFFGDGSAGIVTAFNLAPGKSQTISVEYQRF